MPTEATAELALRTQQIVAFESGAPDTADPLGGAYFVERLTDDLEAMAEALLGEVERLGGGLRAVETGYFARQIESRFAPAFTVIRREGFSILYPAWYRVYRHPTHGAYVRALWNLDRMLNRTPLWSSGEHLLYVLRKPDAV